MMSDISARELKQEHNEYQTERKLSIVAVSTEVVLELTDKKKLTLHDAEYIHICRQGVIIHSRIKFCGNAGWSFQNYERKC